MATDHDSPDSETAHRAAPAAGLFGAIGRTDQAKRGAEARLIEVDTDFAGNFRAGTRTRPSDAPASGMADDDFPVASEITPDD